MIARLRHINEEIRRTQLRIKDLEDPSIKSSSDTSVVFATTSTTTDKVSKTALTLIELKEKLQKLLDERTEAENDIYRIIECLPLNEWQVVKLRWIDGYNIEQVSIKSGYCERHVLRILAKAKLSCSEYL